MAQESVLEGTEKLRGDIHQMCRQTVKMLKLTWEGFKAQDVALLQQAERLGQQIHQQEKTLTTLAVQQSSQQAGTPGVVQGLFLVPVHLERIGDNIELLVRALTTVVQEGIPFTERAVRELNILFEKAIELLECVRDVIPTQNRVLIHHIQVEGPRYGEMIDEYALSHQQRLIEGVCLPRASSIFVALLDYLKGIESHICQIAAKLSIEPAV
jgi:Na+/phosphate symporter